MPSPNDWSPLFGDVQAHTAYVDWKAESADVLHAVRAVWAARYPMLTGAVLDDLTENYAVESCDLYLPALGQELLLLQLRLYMLDSDGDDYCLVVVADAEADAFLETAKAHKQTPQWQKQVGRKPGEPARRLKLANRLPYRKCALDNSGMQQAGAHALLERYRSSSSAFGWISLQAWPPVEQAMPLGANSRSIAHHLKSGAVAMLVKDRNITTLQITHTQLIDASWQIVACSDVLHPLSQMAFAKDDLWIVSEGTVWNVIGAASGGRECLRALQVTPNREFEFPAFARSGDGRDWLLLAGEIYLIDTGRLHRTSLPLRAHTDFRCMPTARGFSYLFDTGLQVDRSREVALVELDTSTGQERMRDMGEKMNNKATVHELADGWSILLRWGQAERQYDLAQFWHPQSDRWLRMPYGALGKGEFREVLVSPSQEIWAGDSSGLLNLGSLDALLHELSVRKNGVLQATPWSDWSEASAIPVVGSGVPKVQSSDKEVEPKSWWKSVWGGKTS